MDNLSDFQMSIVTCIFPSFYLFLSLLLMRKSFAWHSFSLINSLNLICNCLMKNITDCLILYCWFLFLFRLSQKTLLGLDTVFWLCVMCADFCSSWWLCHLLVSQLSAFCRAHRILGSVHRSYAWSSSILSKSCESIYHRNEVCHGHILSFFDLYFGEVTN